MKGDQASGLRAHLRAADRSRRAHVVGLLSGKGGVGKSVVAVNLATHAASQGARVLLIDGDAGLANADLLLGIAPRYDLDDWVDGRVPLSALGCQGPCGVQLLVAGTTAASHAALRSALDGARGDPLGDLLAAHDLVLLDLGAGVGETPITLASACDRAFLVVTPEPTSLADAYTTAKRLWRVRLSLPVELVVNRAADRRAGERTHQALERLTRRFLDRGLPLRSVLPEDAALGRSVGRQAPVILEAPDAAVTRGLRGLAEQLLDELPRRGDRASRPADAGERDRAAGPSPGLAG